MHRTHTLAGVSKLHPIHNLAAKFLHCLVAQSECTGKLGTILMTSLLALDPPRYFSTGDCINQLIMKPLFEQGQQLDILRIISCDKQIDHPLLLHCIEKKGKQSASAR
jgi:hypothetical protein